MVDETGLDDVGSLVGVSSGEHASKDKKEGMTATSWVCLPHGTVGAMQSTWLFRRTLQQGRNKRVLAAAGLRQYSQGKSASAESGSPCRCRRGCESKLPICDGARWSPPVAQHKCLQGSVSLFLLLVSAP